MQAFTKLTAIAAPLPMANVDTDMIIPKQYPEDRSSRKGLAKGLFYELRTDAEAGNPTGSFVLDQAGLRQEAQDPGRRRANFGCGSSREHAPWALLDAGIRCVIAPSFADIFYNNCFKNGLLPIALPQEAGRPADGRRRARRQRHASPSTWRSQTITGPDGGSLASSRSIPSASTAC